MAGNNNNSSAFYVYPGISLDHPIVVSCGSGVTACILALVWNLPQLSWILPCICEAISNNILFAGAL